MWILSLTIFYFKNFKTVVTQDKAKPTESKCTKNRTEIINKEIIIGDCMTQNQSISPSVIFLIPYWVLS